MTIGTIVIVVVIVLVVLFVLGRGRLGTGRR
jgi:hypothetical protein